MENGNLDEMIHNKDDHDWRWKLTDRIDAMVAVANGLVYLHTGYDFPIVHCDLKPSNVLLDGDMNAHVSDFGIARILGVHLDDEMFISTVSVFQDKIGYLAPGNIFAYVSLVVCQFLLSGYFKLNFLLLTF